MVDNIVPLGSGEIRYVPSCAWLTWDKLLKPPVLIRSQLDFVKSMFFSQKIQFALLLKFMKNLNYLLENSLINSHVIFVKCIYKQSIYISRISMDST